MHARFGSTVHFVPNPNSKEFFLEVSFSSASFPLSVESVGLALQSCIGGISEGFKVIRLGDRRFRFSVASNRVGHFIYGLRDRIWPDFICHFHLFRPEAIRSNHLDNFWHSDIHSPEVASRSPVAFRSKLSFLQGGLHHTDASKAELQKFGFVPPSTMVARPESSSPNFSPARDHSAILANQNSNTIGKEPSSELIASSLMENITFGSLPSTHNDRVMTHNARFEGCLFREESWQSIPDFIL